MPETDDKEERIRQRAYQLWIESGQPEGKENDHWERARSEMEGQTGKPNDEPVTPPPGTSFGP